MIFMITSAIGAGFALMIAPGFGGVAALGFLWFCRLLLDPMRCYLPEQVVNWLEQVLDRLWNRKLRTFGWLFCAGFVLALLNLMM